MVIVMQAWSEKAEKHGLFLVSSYFCMTQDGIASIRDAWIAGHLFSEPLQHALGRTDAPVAIHRSSWWVWNSAIPHLK